MRLTPDFGRFRPGLRTWCGHATESKHQAIDITSVIMVGHQLAKLAQASDLYFTVK
jgi:hypothetical protein